MSICLLFANCSSKSVLYSHYDKKRYYAGELNNSDFSVLRKLLTNHSFEGLKDTLIIKYDYNKETCWDMLDQQDDAYIMGFITRHKQTVADILSKRKNVSIFAYREPGDNINKLKKWDDSIIIDSSKVLFNLLFKDRTTCGSSIMVMPDKRYVFMRSDSHSEILDLPADRINNVLRIR